jgi:hypothetical protein
MNSSVVKIARRIVATLFMGCSLTAAAQVTFTTSSPFVAVDGKSNDVAAVATSDPNIFDNEVFTGSGDDAYVGAAVNLAGVGPQAKITSATLYAYASETTTYQHISARLRFWNAYNATANAVFGKPSEFVVVIATCPCNFVAGRTYSVNIVLPKPIYTSGVNGIGFSQVWEVDAGDGNLSASSELVPALDVSGHAALIGANVAAYANLGRSPDDLNFASSEKLLAKSLGLRLQGEALTLDQCTGTSNFHDQFVEEFDDANAFLHQHWNAHANDGTFSVGTGYLALNALDGAAQFPYITSVSGVLPATGDFSVRWLARYDSVGGAGDGALVLSAGKPLNGDDANLSTAAMREWQDVTSGFSVNVRTDPATFPNGFGGMGTNLHDLQYCWVGGTVELWADGSRVFQSARAAGVPHPDTLWMGNPTVAISGPWNDVTLYRIQVRTPAPAPLDEIFFDAFETKPVQ